MLIVPSIDLRGGNLVRLQQGDYNRQLNYSVDPNTVARGFVKAGAQWMHIVDLDGAKEGKPVQLDLIGQLIEDLPIQVQVGGGVRSTADVEALLDLGVDRVVIGTKAIEDWPWFDQLAHTSDYAEKIVLAIDARDGVIATRAWTRDSGVRAVDLAAKVSDWPLAGLLYTDVAKDGMLGGPNYEQTAALAEAGKVPVIASGGVGSVQHLLQLAKLPLWGAIIGRSLHDGRIDLAEAILQVQNSGNP